MNKHEIFETLSRDAQAMEVLRYLQNQAYIRVVNYHNTDPVDIPRFEREFEAFARDYCPVTLKDIDDFLDTKVWKKDKPGLIPTFFEGFRNQHDYILPILEKYGFVGWFYIPSFYMDVPVAEQLEFSELYELDIYRPEVYPDGRYAMNWDEVRRVAEKHEICCHTGNHFEIGLDTPDSDMFREIVVSKKILEAKIGRKVDVFCWLYGKDFAYNPRAQKYIRKAGYRYVLGNSKLERIG